MPAASVHPQPPGITNSQQMKPITNSQSMKDSRGGDSVGKNRSANKDNARKSNGGGGSFLFSALPSDPFCEPDAEQGLYARKDPDIWTIPRDLSEGQPWTLRPLMTNPVGITVGLIYVLILGMFAYIFQGYMLQIQSISIDYQSSPACSEVTGVSDITQLGKRMSENYECFQIPSQDGTATTVVEKFIITVGYTMEKPIHIYHEIDGMYKIIRYQNHFRYVKSQEADAPFQLHRYGTYNADASWQTGTKKTTWVEAETVPNPSEDGMNKFWHPKMLTPGGFSGGGNGCFPHWSTNDSMCMDNADSCKYGQEFVTESNGDKHVKGNRPVYPCGLAFRSVITDTFAITDHVEGSSMEAPPLLVDQSLDKITSKIDWDVKYRNLNPLGIFDRLKAKQVTGIDDAEGLLSQLNGRRYNEVFSFWMVRDFPPAHCSDDPLRLLKPETVKYYPETADCQNYVGYDPDPASNQATCTYSTNSTIRNPVSGQKITCGSQKPIGGGWNLENPIAINWVRLAAMSNFWKLAGKIDETWEAGEKKVIYIANRYDVSIWKGKKKLILTGKPNWAGNRAMWLPTTLFLCAAGALTFAVIALVYFGTGNSHLERIKYLAWNDYGPRKNL